MATTTTTTTTNPNKEPLSPSPKSSSSLYYKDMEDLQKVFNQFDANGDGLISNTELGDVLKSMGSNYTTDELKRVMEDIDTDKDGFINLAEFEHFCRSSSGAAAAAAAELRDAFDLYDQNKDGLISATELHQVLNRLGMKCTVDECVRMIEGVDSDGDHSVSFEEFQKMMSCNMSNGAS